MAGRRETFGRAGWHGRETVPQRRVNCNKPEPRALCPLTPAGGRGKMGTWRPIFSHRATRSVYTCPHCGEPGISSWDKWLLQPPWGPGKCSLCGGRVAISWLGYCLAHAPGVLITVVPPLLWYFHLLSEDGPWFLPVFVVWIFVAILSSVLGKFLCFLFVPVSRL
jgi:hypothetical protein